MHQAAKQAATMTQVVSWTSGSVDVDVDGRARESRRLQKPFEATNRNLAEPKGGDETQGKEILLKRVKWS